MQSILESQLNSFDPDVRAEALEKLARAADYGEISVEAPSEIANMHCHTFYSYNGYGYSPAALAWLARRKGIRLMGIVDFDVLDAVEEFLSACDLAGVRGSAGMETRVFLPEFATREINSPGEPGITYHMGIGFTAASVPVGSPEAAAILADMRQRAERRNREVLERVNAYLAPLVLDYDADVLPLTPSGNATERHMCAALNAAAARQTDDPVAFWAGKLGAPAEEIAAILGDGPKIQNLIRSKLMKKGGAGYVQPGPSTFPTLEEVNSVITACRALPCITWLDGLSEGERAAEELYALMIRKGAVALNIVPDRNWNLKDPEQKRVKLQKLHEVVELARQLELPLNVGTEMNAPGLPLVDDFAAAEMAPLREVFMDGAYFIYGHTALERAAGMGYASPWAAASMPSRGERNAFYSLIGRVIPPGASRLARINATLHEQMAPDEVIGQLRRLV